MTYANDARSRRTNVYQKSLNGKHDNFRHGEGDRIALAESISVPGLHNIIHEVVVAEEKWPQFTSEADCSDNEIE